MGLSGAYLERQCDNGLLVWVPGAGPHGAKVILKASLDQLPALLMQAHSDSEREQ